MKIKTKFTLNEVLDIFKEKKLNRDEYLLLYSDFKTQVGKEGYLQFRVNEKDKWKNVHTLINQYFNLKEYDKKFSELVKTKIERCLVTHHIGFFEKENKLNNHPDNLQWMGWNEHVKYHSFIIREIIDRIWNPENHEYCNFEMQREKIIKSSKSTMDKIWNPKNSEYNNYEEQRKKVIKSSKTIIDKIWNPENPEYCNYEECRKNNFIQINSMSLNLWYGENSETYREKKSQISIKNNYELWHGENNIEHRKNMLPTQIKNLKKGIDKLWNSEGNEENRKRASEIGRFHISKHNEEYWHGEGNEERRFKQGLRIVEVTREPLQNLWHGEGNEEYRKIMAESGKKVMNIINRDPSVKIKIQEGKVFQTFNKIILAGEKITDETFFKYKSKFCTYPKTVFGSIENAVEKYRNYPKRVKL